jgi:hypothetical protein
MECGSPILNERTWHGSPYKKKIDACYEPPAKLRFPHIRAVDSVPELECPHKHSEAAINAYSFSLHAACACRHQLALSIGTPTPGTLISVLLLLLHSWQQ